MILPTHLSRAGYNTAGVGKILHWDGNNKDVWNYDQYDNDWYGYQGNEDSYMNSSTMPDKVRQEHNFRDHEFSMKTIEILEKLVKEPKHFMLGVGFKLPHLALHVPYDFYSIYKTKEKRNMWKLSKKELRFPASTTEIAWRCCVSTNRNVTACDHSFHEFFIRPAILISCEKKDPFLRIDLSGSVISTCHSQSKWRGFLPSFHPSFLPFPFAALLPFLSFSAK
jgi:hypothetical protein